MQTKPIHTKSNKNKQKVDMSITYPFNLCVFIWNIFISFPHKKNILIFFQQC